MPWWSRKAPRGPRYAASFERVAVTAAAKRVDLGNEKDVARVGKSQEKWQADAWYYTDVVGEMKYAERFIANAFRQVRLFAAYQRDADSPPIAVTDALAPTDPDADLPSGEELPSTPPDTPGATVDDPLDFLDEKWAILADETIRGFAARDGGQAALMERLGVNLFIPGECYLVNRPVPERAPLPNEDASTISTVLDWEVRSVDEIIKSDKDAKRVMVIDAPGQRTGTELTENDYIERIWRKHGRWSSWADSNVRSAIGTLELLDLLARLARSSVRSRLVAGLALFPDELDFGGVDEPSGEGSGTGHKGIALDRELAELFTSVVGDETDAASIAPAIARGPAEWLKEVRVVEFPRRYGAEERAMHDEAIDTLARTVDLPVEVVKGHMGTTFANALQINQDTYDDHLAPLVDVAREALTYALLRPTMLEAGCPPEIIERLLVGADPSQLIRNPDRGKVADEGHKNLALSDDAWRRANDFGDDDAPSDDEVRRRLAMSRGHISDVLACELLESVGIVPEGTTQMLIDAASKSATTGGTAVQGSAMLATVASIGDGLTAAGVGRVGRRLSTIDAHLRTRVLAHADMAVARAIERAGARLRTRARKASDKAAVSAAADVPNSRLAAAVGEDVVQSVLGDDPISADDFADLGDRFDTLTAAAQTAALAVIARHVTLTDAQIAMLRSTQDDERAAAWAFLLSQLVTYAGYRLTAAEDDADPATGEINATSSVRPSLVRAALAIAGGIAFVGTTLGGITRDSDGPGGSAGGAVGGVATGDTILGAAASAGMTPTSYVWDYGDPAARVRPFEEHEQLDGIEFTDWDDAALAGYEPGDHANCLCDYEIVFDEPASADADQEG